MWQGSKCQLKDNSKYRLKNVKRNLVELKVENSAVQIGN